MTMDTLAPSLLNELLEIYSLRATGRYGLTRINQLAHALQAAALAEAENATAALITAALLHDIGHMIHDLGDNPAAGGIDDRHEATGADWLAARFPASVSQPVRLHVAAKRYLCAVEPGYRDRLSPDSVRSLALQGGPMSAAEADVFIGLPWSAEAIRLRRFDEAAKVPGLATPQFEHFLRYAGAASAAA